MLSEQDFRRIFRSMTSDARFWCNGMTGIEALSEKPSREVLKYQALVARQLADRIDFIADHMPPSVTERPKPMQQRPRRHARGKSGGNIRQFPVVRTA